MSEAAYNIMEELDLLMEIAKAYGPNYLSVIPDSVYRILDLLQTIPDLSFIEREDVESIEEFHERSRQEQWVKQHTNQLELEEAEEVEEDEDDWVEDYVD
jgi:hypothetical protein